jgi:hypothetical protein
MICFLLAVTVFEKRLGRYGKSVLHAGNVFLIFEKIQVSFLSSLLIFKTF